MGWWGRGAARKGAFAIVVALLASFPLGLVDAGAQGLFSGDFCRRPPVERGRENALEQRVNVSPVDVYRQCAPIAENPRSRADQQANAQYYTARAIATLHEQGQLADPQELDRAGMMLELVVRLPWDDADVLRERAQIQLARIYRLRAEAARASGRLVDGQYLVQALALLDGAIGLAPSNTGPNAAVALDARYERALVYLQRQEAGDAEAALRDLSVFSVPGQPSSAWSATGQRGRARLIELANRLGDQAMEAAPTQANVDRALEYYARAQAAVETGGAPPAGVSIAQIYIDLGAATLRKAALERGVGVDQRCEYNGTDPDAARLLVQARGHFQRAAQEPGHPPAAEQGLGCALLALGDIERAILAFQAANAAGARDLDSALELASAYAGAAAILNAQRSSNPAEEARARAAAQQFWTLAEGTYQQALGMVGDDRRRRARINVDLAETRRARGDLAGASQALSEALADQPNSAEALLARGTLICGQDRFCTSLTGVGTLGQARADLTAVVDQLPPPDAAVRSEAHYYLSLLANRDRTLGGDGAAAVRHADAAFSLAMTPSYREHACLMRIRYYHLRGVGERDERARDEGTRYCLAGENRTPETLLLEGEYHLSRARSLPGGARDRAREEAYSTFGDALRLLGRSESPAHDLLRARLELGQAFVQYCMGLEGVGLEAIRRIDADGTIRQYFVDHAVWDCSER